MSRVELFILPDPPPFCPRCRRFCGNLTFLAPAMFFQESKSVAAPDRDPRIRKTVAFLRRPAKCRINLHLEGFARLFHRGRKGPARRKIVIILGLKKENRRARM